MPDSSRAQTLLASARRRAARSRRLTNLAVLMRNQCQMVIAQHLGDHRRDGEYRLLRALGPNMTTFVDVGANVGDWSDEALRVAPGARGLLLEPSASAFSRLTERFGDGKRVTLLNAAAGAAPGTAVFYEEPGGGETASLVPGVSRPDATPRTVDVTTVGEAVARAEMERVDILKIDAEGYDLAVLRGAEPLFAEGCIGAVQFEYNWSWAAAGATLGGALSFLERFGLTSFVVRIDRLEEFSYARYGEYFGLTEFVALSDETLRRHSAQLFE